MRFTYRSFGPERSLTVGGFVDGLEQFLSSNARVIGGFQDGLIFRGPTDGDGVVFDYDLQSFRRNATPEIRSPKARYRGADGGDHAEMRMDSYAPYYVASVVNSRGGWDDPAYVGIDFGGQGLGQDGEKANSVVLHFHPDGTGHNLTNSNAIREFLLSDVMKRRPHLANCTTAAFRRATEFDRKADRFDVGWLTYFDDPTLARVLRPVAPTTELEGGTLVQVCDEVSDLMSEDAIARGRGIRQALIDVGYLHSAATPG